MWPAGDHWPVAGSYSSALLSTAAPMPPAARTRPSGSVLSVERRGVIGSSHQEVSDHSPAVCARVVYLSRVQLSAVGAPRDQDPAVVQAGGGEAVADLLHRRHRGEAAPNGVKAFDGTARPIAAQEKDASVL